MPDGRRYLWVAKAVAGRSRGFDAPVAEFSVALGCAVENVGELIYADGLDLDNTARATPIGAGCRVCDRRDCVQRAFPQSGVDITAPEDSQGASPLHLLREPSPAPALTDRSRARGGSPPSHLPGPHHGPAQPT